MSQLFFNGEIYPSDGDFVIGGFYTDKTDGFTYSDFKFAYISRVKELLDKFIDTTTLLYTKNGRPNPHKQALEDAAKIVCDNLETELGLVDAEGILNSIVQSTQSQSWLLGIKLRINHFEPTLTEAHNGIINKTGNEGVDTEFFETAKEFTDNTTLESLIEQLSMIES